MDDAGRRMPRHKGTFGRKALGQIRPHFRQILQVLAAFLEALVTDRAALEMVLDGFVGRFGDPTGGQPFQLLFIQTGAHDFYQSASIWTQRKPFKPLTTRAYEWVDERFKIAKPLNDILKKPVPKFARWWWYCLGGITFFLFVIQATTGILLAFYYKPTAAEAYASIQFIENEVRFGAAIRAIHHWSANGMIVMCIAHMIRVFIMGAYRKPRELNWVSGVFLLVLTLAFGFTGYLLPWDQRAFWATTVGTEIAGAVPAVGTLVLIYLRDGWGVTEATLGRFYGLHVFIVPIATVIFMGAHFLMVRATGVKRPL